ncbi:hypothetical protein ACS0TY_018865 [Phlomoides rotata]
MAPKRRSTHSYNLSDDDDYHPNFTEDSDKYVVVESEDLNEEEKIDDKPDETQHVGEEVQGNEIVIDYSSVFTNLIFFRLVRLCKNGFDKLQKSTIRSWLNDQTIEAGKKRHMLYWLASEVENTESLRGDVGKKM